MLSQIPPIVCWYVVLFIIQPAAEYAAHRALHVFKIKAHMEHHRVITKENYDNYVPSNIPTFMSVLGWIVVPKLALLWACILKYQLTHFLVHSSDVLPRLKRHHMIHHLCDPRVNFGFSEMWIDDILGTSSNTPSSHET